ncbi:hypothetical protein M3Y96_01257600 [Aphelenchoides besseyi]|nr:hypothetical protein M3Y96_01257600 [Aphelenchoides besseyi]
MEKCPKSTVQIPANDRRVIPEPPPLPSFYAMNEGNNIPPVNGDGTIPPLTSTGYMEQVDTTTGLEAVEVTINVIRADGVKKTINGIPVAVILGSLADGRSIQIKAWREMANQLATPCRLDRKISIDFLRCTPVNKSFNNGDFLYELTLSSRSEIIDHGPAETTQRDAKEVTLDDLPNAIGEDIVTTAFVQKVPRSKNGVHLGRVVHGSSMCMIEMQVMEVPMVTGQQVRIYGRFRLPGTIMVSRYEVNEKMMFAPMIIL